MGYTQMMSLRTKTELMEHQKKAFEKVKNLKVMGLFMEMGTGKTRTILEVIKHKLEKGKIQRVLYFCPASVLLSTKKEIEKHCVDVNISIDYNNPALITLLSIEGVSQSENQYIWLAQNIGVKDFLIVDESSKIKNYEAKRTIRLIRVSRNAEYKAILTGTPVSNGLQDLYSQMTFLSPKILGYTSYYSFLNNHGSMREYRDADGVKKESLMQVRDTVNNEYITKRIFPYIFQINSDECFELPDKNYSVYISEMTQKQKNEYEYVKEESLKEMERKLSFSGILALLTNLQLVASNLYPGGKQIDKDNNKIALLDGILEEVQGKTLILFKYNGDAKQLKEKFKVPAIVGSTSFKERDRVVEEFKNNDSPILLANLNCMSFGHNLQFMRNIVFYNNSYSLEKRLQAEKRLHRFGQQNNVNIIDLITKDSIEELIFTCLEEKISITTHFKKIINELQEITDIAHRNKTLKNIINNI